MLSTLASSHKRTSSRPGRSHQLYLASCAALAIAISAPAAAQQTPPLNVDVDENGVDLVSGNFVTSITEGSIGSGEGAVAYTRSRSGASTWIDNWSGGLLLNAVGSVTTAYVLFGPSSDAFTSSGSTYTPVKANGSSLASNLQGYLYTAADGTKVQFNTTGTGLAKGYPLVGYACGEYAATCGIPVSITKPNGMTFTLTYAYSAKCTSGAGTSCVGPKGYYRLGGVSSSAGYGFTINYVTNAPGTFSSPVPDWTRRTSITFSNANNSASPAPTVTYSPSYGYFPDFTDPAGRSWHFVGGNGVPLTSIQRPGASAPSTVITMSSTSPAYVSTITQNGITTNYSRMVGGNIATTTITDAQSNQRIVVADLSIARVTKDTRMLPTGNLVTAYTYDTSGRLTDITYPEGNIVHHTYDARGNRTSTTFKAKPSVGGADIVTTADFDATCTNAVKCNQPNWTKDARLNQTDYVYDSTTGQVTSVTLPAATSGGVRPQTRYGYGSVAGVWMLTSVSSCQTLSSCAGSADEIKQTIAYNSNLLPQTITGGAGDNSLVASQSLTYDSRGNVLSVDGPLAGADDTTTYRYNGGNELVGTIGPDPDGGGALKRGAIKTSYNDAGQPLVSEIGNVNGTSDTDWAGFASAQQTTSSYDANGFKTADTVTAAGAAYQLTQYSYDSLGRLDCTALRMNSATWGSLPGACSPATAGSAGPDRITRNLYDPVGRVAKVQTAYGTPEQADEVTNGYTANGQLAYVIDGEGNKTSYEYDGQDRLSITRYPVATTGAGASSGSDYEQLGYDATGNVLSRRLRDGQTITYGYDNLNRMISKATPGSVRGDYDVSYTYDLLGRLASATGDGTFGNNRTYDALGRLVTEANYNATTTHGYDLAGRQTRLTWSDGFYVDYDYNVAGEVTAIRENGATSGVGLLASYIYDDLGRRTSVTRGNGTTTAYGYDGVSRLASLTQDLSGSAYDFVHAFTYNPAGQIVSLTKSNDGYAWNGHYNVDRSYPTDGLNQVTAAGATSIGYDGRGNLTASGSQTYNYTTENRLEAAPGARLLYEPSGDQILQLYNSSTGQDTRFAWSGSQMIAELNGYGLAITRRYVPGPGTDEPLVWYEGSGTGDKRWLHADERGSVVAVSDAAGNAIGVNRYDEYGIPAATNIGRFQYTGQAWLPELGMYYYKARIYSPTLGRFMQSDPSGYGDGMNMYNYVAGDPVNLTDPTGLLKAGCVWVTGSRIPNCEGRDAARGYVERRFTELTGDAQAAAIDTVAKFVTGDITLGSAVSSLIQQNAILCVGAWNCDSYPFSAIAGPAGELNKNKTFRDMAAEAWGIAIDRQVEVGFGGIGFGDFKPTTHLIISEFYDHIPKKDIDAIAATGANVFFHTHQYMGGFPGFSKTDQQTCSSHGFFCVTYAGAHGRGGDYGWYYYRNALAKRTR